MECWLISNDRDKQQFIPKNSVSHTHTDTFVLEKFNDLKDQDVRDPVWKWLSSFLSARLYKRWTETRSGNQWRTGDSCCLEFVMSSTWAWLSETFRLVCSRNGIIQTGVTCLVWLLISVLITEWACLHKINSITSWKQHRFSDTPFSTQFWKSEHFLSYLISSERRRSSTWLSLSTRTHTPDFSEPAPKHSFIFQIQHKFHKASAS